MPSAIITGATGYIGSHVTRLLLNSGWNVAIISDPKFGYDNIQDIIGELTVFEYHNDIACLNDFFTEYNADVVMHLAAAVITNPSSDDISTLIRSNIEFGTQVLQAMYCSNTRRLINTGSYWQNYNSDTYNPVDLYAATKEAFEKIIQYYTDAHDFRAITLRLFDVCGEDDRRPKLWTILKNFKPGDPEINLTPGEQLIDLVYISDVANAYLKAYELLESDKEIKNEIFGVYTGNPKSLKDIVEEFRSIATNQIQLNWGAKPYGKRTVMKPSTSYKRLPNWQPKKSLKDILERLNSTSSNMIL